MVLLNERFKLVQMVIRMDENTCNKDLLRILFLEICKIGCFSLTGKRPGTEKIKYNDRLGDLFKKKLVILNGNGMKYSLFVPQAEMILPLGIVLCCMVGLFRFVTAVVFFSTVFRRDGLRHILHAVFIGEFLFGFVIACG
jgi:hypothetical protein